MATFRLLDAAPVSNPQAGDILACAYSPDGAFLLSGAWDGHLRLWETNNGNQVTAFKASPKPVSACAVAPDGRAWLSGSLDGLLSQWDPVTHRQTSIFLAHPRPISTIVFGVDGRTLITAAWDGNVAVWQLARDREARILAGHSDIVAGCRPTPGGESLLSWSYDGTARLWDLTTYAQQAEFSGHNDRVLAGAVSPDGRWAVTGSRDGMLKLWDLREGSEAATTNVDPELRGCFFLAHGDAIVVVDAAGRLTLHSVPDLRESEELATGLKVHCADLAASSQQIALGCSDGQVRLVAVNGLEDSPLVVIATQASRREATMFQKFLGKSHLVHFYQCSCPVCRAVVPLASGEVGRLAMCSRCRRKLRVGGVRRSTHEQEVPVA